MKKITALIITLMAIQFTGHAVAKDLITNSVVKIYTVSTRYSYENPWQMSGQSKGTGSGCIIDGNRILTNAHVISNSTFLQVKKAGEAEKYIARIISVSHESDLAILTVDDPGFFKNSTPVKIGELAQVRDRIAVYGFPTGGDEMSITEGVVSRIEQRNYAHSSANLLTCQIDAAINPGNSGGPVIINNMITGVAFQSATMGENIGYMVPAPVIKHFLDDIADGRYDGFPELGIKFQDMENPALREKYGMKPEQSGVMVIDILVDSPSRNILAVEDVLLSIDGVPVANDGTVEFRKGERTSLNYVVQKKHINDYVALKILRKGTVRDLRVRLTVNMNSTRLVPFEQYDVKPEYYINGGLVFSPLTKNYLLEWGRQWFFSAPTKLLYYYQNEVRSADRKQVILLVKVLADEINLGYHDFENLVIVRVNDRKVSTIEDVVKAFEENRGTYHVVEDDTGVKIIITRESAEKFSQRILETYRIDSDRSAGLKK
ncbi:MAG TPA: serine protease [Spirochaetota bacterium]|nr:serine protease [Spirochaetota bacterium]HQO39271.1 serine protease [Spirochaetota bacterium]